jgi:hypothetical protein
MKGVISINEGESSFSLLPSELHKISRDISPDTRNTVSWYAYKIIDGSYRFLWKDNRFSLNRSYLKEIKKDGYILAARIERDLKEGVFS